jgi:hypothetical protein
LNPASKELVAKLPENIILTPFTTSLIDIVFFFAISVSLNTTLEI